MNNTSFNFDMKQTFSDTKSGLWLSIPLALVLIIPSLIVNKFKAKK